VLEGEIDGDGRTEAARDEVSAVEPRDGHRAAELSRGLDVASGARLRAEAREIDEEHAILRGERSHLRAPHPRVEREAVEHHEGGPRVAPTSAGFGPVRHRRDPL